MEDYLKIASEIYKVSVSLYSFFENYDPIFYNGESKHKKKRFIKCQSKRYKHIRVYIMTRTFIEQTYSCTVIIITHYCSMNEKERAPRIT